MLLRYIFHRIPAYAGVIGARFGKATLFAFLCLSVFFASTAQAADPKPTIRDEAYAAKFVSQTVKDPVTIEAGKTKEVAITFKNVGSATWNGNSSQYISAYTMEPRYRVSPFLSGKQTAKISGVVKPGGTGVLTIQLKAPEKTGEYVERFYLASENNTWVKGSYFFLKINVVPATVVKEAVETVVEEAPEVQTAFLARVMGQNKKEVSVKGGEQVKLVLIYRNKGAESWKKLGLRVGSPTALALSGKRITFADPTWQADTLVKNINKEIVAEGIVRETIYFRAPQKKGEYEAKFFLAADDVAVAGSEAVVNVHVTENAPLNYVAPTFGTDDIPVKPTSYRLTSEPRLRVGLVGEGNKAQVISYEDDYLVYDGPREMGILPKRKIGKLSEQGGIFRFIGGELDFKSTEFIRLEPKSNEHAIFEISQGLEDRSIAWVGPSKFVRYHGAVEYRKGVIDKKLYLVNHVLLEDYVAGISETGHNVAFEAVKANLVAARTYAYVSKGKYPFFDVLGSTYDQLYLGADVGKYLGNVPKAAQATRGQVVTYKHEVVITPYFGNSSGTTRAWHSVWGGKAKAWLVPVAAKYDAGRRRFGHGVGMSQRDAGLRAKKDGWTSEQLLTHYYSGTEVEALYR